MGVIDGGGPPLTIALARRLHERQPARPPSATGRRVRRRVDRAGGVAGRAGVDRAPERTSPPGHSTARDHGRADAAREPASVRRGARGGGRPRRALSGPGRRRRRRPRQLQGDQRPLRHDVGDLVLRAFAAAIRTNVRDVDLPARYGGEEFTVLLPATDAEGGRQLAERLRRAGGAQPRQRRRRHGPCAVELRRCQLPGRALRGGAHARCRSRALPRQGGGQEPGRRRRAEGGGRSMTSGDPGSVARCHFCGREFDVRRFQVRVIGSRGVYDSTDCALSTAEWRLLGSSGTRGR